MAGDWLSDGWSVFGAEPPVQAWIGAVGADALGAAQTRQARTPGLRHGGTWFAGVDHLPNAPDGSVAGGPAFRGAARTAAEALVGPLPLHRAQVSITYPGYPAAEGDHDTKAHRYRLLRDAAHLDGLLPEGTERRRHLREPHAYILGVALTDASPDAAPLVVYAGSHAIMRAAFAERFAGAAPEAWGDLDVTETYQAARRRCFEMCPRIELPLRKAETVLLHRLSLHGIAPWREGAAAAPEGRAIAYFRPQLPRVEDWLALP